MYARVYGAGHMINENKPEVAKDLFYKWMRNEWQDSASIDGQDAGKDGPDGDGWEL